MTESSSWTENVWKIIDCYFRDNHQLLVRHHMDSYNDFFKHGIYQMFRERNPVILTSNYDSKLDDYSLKCHLYMGGINGDRLYIGKPVIYDDGRTHYMFPNEARLRNMTYGMTIHYDVEVEITKLLQPGEEPEKLFMVSSGGKEYSASIVEDNDTQRVVGGGPRKKSQTVDVGDYSPSEMKYILEETNKSVTQDDQNNMKIQKYKFLLEKVYLGKFPIMLQSEFCVLNGIPREIKYQMGECLNDYGGYFIIDGKEKIIIPQEKFADNMLYIRKYESPGSLEPEAMMEENTENEFLYSAEIRSVSENISKPTRTLSVKVVAPTSKLTQHNIVVNIPNVRKPVPLFILFRALGFLSDKEIITMCLLDLEKNEDLLDFFVPSIHESGGIMSQMAALRFIAVLTKGKTFAHVHSILSDFFLPHIGETNYVQKAYYLGYMVHRLVRVWGNIDQPINRDSYKFKRIETSGELIGDLFREYYKIQQKQIFVMLDREKNLNLGLYNSIDGMIQLVTKKELGAFMTRDLEIGVKKAFKGNWGAYAHTKKIGVLQDINRLSYLSTLNHLRKTTLHLDAGLKLVGPRLLHASQWGYFDAIDSPDGSDIGLHKHLTLGAHITKSMSREPIVAWLREKVNMRTLEECTPKVLHHLTKVFVNGYWAGVITEPLQVVENIKLHRRNALLPIYLSVYFDIAQNTIYLYCDGGRLSRPIFYFDDSTGKFSYETPKMKKLLENEDSLLKWQELISGFHTKKAPGFSVDAMKLYDLYELYGEENGIGREKNPAKIEKFIKEKAVIDYVDNSESEGMLVCMNPGVLADHPGRKYTHMEIHESLCFSMMCNLTNFLENNPATRNNFSCGQSKQAVSMYHSNHQMRMDKAAVVLDCGQTPLVKSRYLEYINHEQHPYGENAIVAIMCYTGYNVEDAILVNEGAIQRGLFRTTYYSTYETHEEKGTKEGMLQTSDKQFANIENLLLSGVDVHGKRVGYEYDKLDEYGIIKEGTEIHDKVVIIGMTSFTTDSKTHFDECKTTKKGQLGIVDKTLITEGEVGERIAKVRVREVRMPAHGDKMASRAGQKGTVGLIIPEKDMPFTKDGIKPDLIINPHAVPTRMTIGQLVECIAGKAAALYGGFANCTAYSGNTMDNIRQYGELLTTMGYHSSGNEIMYNGYTGEQMDSVIFMGPTYYMRLKHMVKDKINYRTTGPRSKLTRQTVGGRANDGGLRIGEMERDAVIAHGAVNMLTESMMERGDKYYMAVCNKTGMIAVYNPNKNLFYSPMADGPIQYVGSFNDPENQMHIKHISKFGRSFSIVCVPYTMKLLLQELQSMNVVMRIITEENIDQIENMKFSKNVEKLLQMPVKNMQTVVDMNKNILKGNLFGQPSEEDAEYINRVETPMTTRSVENPPLSPEYSNVSPALNIPTPVYNESNSPVYVPRTPESEYDNEIFQPSLYGPITPENSPPENLYSPSTPNELPPTSPNYPYVETYIRKGGNVDVFEIGDKVAIYGGNPSQLWKVKDRGNGYVTVMHEEHSSHYPPTEDSIKVVSPELLYYPSPPPSVPGSDYPLHDPMAYPPSSSPFSEGPGPAFAPPPPPLPQALNFSPMIVVGDHNKLPNRVDGHELYNGGALAQDHVNANANHNNSVDLNRPFVVKKSDEPSSSSSHENGGNESSKEEGGGGGNPFMDFFKIRKIG